MKQISKSHNNARTKESIFDLTLVQRVNLAYALGLQNGNINKYRLCFSILDKLGIVYEGFNVGPAGEIVFLPTAPPPMSAPVPDIETEEEKKIREVADGREKAAYARSEIEAIGKLAGTIVSVPLTVDELAMVKEALDIHQNGAKDVRPWVQEMLDIHHTGAKG